MWTFEGAVVHMAGFAEQGVDSLDFLELADGIINTFWSVQHIPKTIFIDAGRGAMRAAMSHRSKSRHSPGTKLQGHKWVSRILSFVLCKYPLITARRIRSSMAASHMV